MGDFVSAVFLLVALLTDVVPHTDAVCESTADEFRSYCSSKYNGVVAGSTCIFLAATATWENAFQVCANQNAFLAQIYTSEEINAASPYVSAAYTWVALRRLENFTGSSYMSLTESFWWDSATSFNPLLSAGNTWSRTRIDDNVYAAASYCTVYWFSGNLRFGDEVCSINYRTLCQVKNPNQTCTYVDNTCVVEVPFVEYSNTASDVCAQNCVKHIACRSFNTFTDGTCQLTSWSYYDNPKQAVVPGCTYYTCT